MYEDFAKTLTDISVLSIPIIEKIIRPIIIYVFLLIALRLAGKRSLASLNSFDLVVLLSISNTVQNAIIGDDTTVSGGIIGASTLLITNYLMVRFFFKHRRLDELIEGKPTTLIKDGKIMKKNLEHEFITERELEIAAHKQGFHTLEDVDSAELEPGGGIAFFEKTPTTEESRNIEIHNKLDALSAQIAQLQNQKPQAPKDSQEPQA